MPTIRANGLDIGYDVRGAGPPLVAPPRRDVARRARTSRPSCPSLSKAFLVHLPDARGHGRTRWDARRRLPVRLARRRPDGVRRRARARLVPPPRVLDGRDDRAPVRGAAPGAAADARRRRDHARMREPRASVGRRLMDPARILEREPEFAAALARRHDAGQGAGAWQRLLPAIAADIAAQPLLAPAELHGIDCPAMVVCGDRDPFVPAGARRRPRAPAARRPAVRRAGLRPRGHGSPAGPVQRGAQPASTASTEAEALAQRCSARRDRRRAGATHRKEDPA